MTIQEVKIEPVVDRDTRGVPGAPRYTRQSSDVNNLKCLYVMSIVIRQKQRLPNPNVLIELGYALKILGKSRIEIRGNNSLLVARSYSPLISG